MKKYKLIILFLLNIFIDLTILSRYQIYGVVPSITLPLIIVLSMYSQNESIVYYAILQGFIQDLAFGNIPGINALIYYIISYYTFNLNKRYSHNLFIGTIVLSISLFVKKVYLFIVDYIYSNNIVKSDIVFKVKNYITEFLILFLIFIILQFIAFRLEKNRIRNLI